MALLRNFKKILGCSWLLDNSSGASVFYNRSFIKRMEMYALSINSKA